MTVTPTRPPDDAELDQALIHAWGAIPAASKGAALRGLRLLAAPIRKDDPAAPMSPEAFAAIVAKMTDDQFDAYLTRLREAGLLTPRPCLEAEGAAA